jgi:hypothetical protein
LASDRYRGLFEIGILIEREKNSEPHLKGGKMKNSFRPCIKLLAGILCFALLSTTASGQLVQTANGTGIGSQAIATFTTTPASGHFLIAIVGTYAGSTIDTPSGWQTAINESGGGGSTPSQAIFYKTAGAGESKSLTVTASGSNSEVGLQIYEYQNIDAVSPVDCSNSNSGYGKTVTTNSVTTTQATDVIIVGIVITGGTSFNSWTNSFTEQNDFKRSSSLVRTYAGGDRIVSSTGAYSSGAMAGSSNYWRAQIVAFKDASPLPIQMASFAANVVRDNDVEVAWKTVSETNNYGFEIYRKRGDAGDWTNIGFVQGHGTTLAAQSYSYLDRALPFGKYSYQIKQVDLDGKSETFPLMTVDVGVAPEKLTLGQNYPNPFNPSTVIEFVVPMSGHASMKVYNVLGQEVATLFNGTAEVGKINVARFDASNLPSGLYFYTLKSAGASETKRMLLMK